MSDAYQHYTDQLYKSQALPPPAGMYMSDPPQQRPPLNVCQPVKHHQGVAAANVYIAWLSALC